ncbi:MAG: cytochrome c, partial [Acidimicrobiia bacterium]|nr:cytochrome c [Acidimicrobiia bacterium]
MAELPRSPARSPLLCLMGVVALASGAAAADKTVWDAVYSEAQAARGKAVYDTRCAPCHGPELAGINFNGPAMKGDRFWAA